jgi:glycosyltransferase involved in cell wall biosynthesis
MRILWFTGVQLPAVIGEDLNRAGWQEGLRRALYHSYPEIKLAIASFGPDSYQPFTVENARYYNIYRQPASTQRWSRLVNNWKHNTFDVDELNRCYEVYDLVQPDLVFIFGTENPFGLLVSQFTVPAVISIQAVLNGLVKRIFSGLSLWELSKELFSRETLVGNGIFHRWWVLKKYSQIEKTIYKQNQLFAGRTDWDRDWLSRLNSGARYFHIDRVLGEIYYQAEWELQNSVDNRIFSLSSNAPFKGGITLVRAIAELKDQGNDTVRLRLAGVDKESNVGRHILDFVERYNLQNQITMLGRLHPSEIVQEMLQSRLFVLPSHMDNSPNSLAEAMLLGMPCIASDAGGIPSMLKDNVEGVLYPHQDIAALAEAIDIVLADSDLAAKLGNQARRTALIRHDPENIARDTYQMYQEVLSQSQI